MRASQPSLLNAMRLLALTPVLTCFAMSSTVAAVTNAQAQRPPPTSIERLFISGHSLTDPPLPQHLSQIAASLGTPLQWNMQSIPGSSIGMRIQGSGPEHAYRHGTNREGRNMDVLAEWRAPVTVSGGPYDALLVTEQHGVLSALTWHQTTDALQSVHAQFLQANPRANTWFYEAWLGLDDLSNPTRWVAYERAAAPVWRCIAARVNASRAKAGHNDRVQAVPSGVALAALVERAMQGKVPGVSASTPQATIKRLLADDVHLTSLGSYYMANVVYATLWDRSPVGAAAPTDVQPLAAAALQQEAWAFVQAHQASTEALTMAQCRALLKDRFIAQHWGYVRDTQWAQSKSKPSAYWQWLKQVVGWQWRIRQAGNHNPFADL